MSPCSDSNKPLEWSRSIFQPGLSARHRSPGRLLWSVCEARPAHSYSAEGSPRNSAPGPWGENPSSWRTPGSAGTTGPEESSSACWTSCPIWWRRQRHGKGFSLQCRIPVHIFNVFSSLYFCDLLQIYGVFPLDLISIVKSHRFL